MTRSAQMRQILSRLASSGLTQKAFAKRERIPYSTLLYWRRRLGKSGLTRRARPASEVLAPVTIVPDVVHGGRAFEVRTPDGLTVSVPGGFDASELERLLAALRRC